MLSTRDAILIAAGVLGISLYVTHKLQKHIEALTAEVSELKRLNILISQKRSDDRPFRLFLVRHGESEGNVNPQIYQTTPDSKILLTQKGRKMAFRSGQAIRQKLLELYTDSTNPPRITVYVSSFLRTQETACEMITGMGETKNWITNVRDSPLLVEQDWGLFEGSGLEGAQDRFPHEWSRCEMMKKHQGKFWARFPLGESCFDVCQRMQLFFGTIFRDRTGGKSSYGKSNSDPMDVAIVVSHGITVRAFAMMWCHRTCHWFENSHNPPNASVRLIDSSIPNWDAGYVFGGYSKGMDLDHPIDVATLTDPEEPNEVQARLHPEEFLFKQHSRWSLSNASLNSSTQDLRPDVPESIETE